MNILSKIREGVDKWIGDGNRVFSEGALRITVGLLGVLLPVSLLVYSKLIGECNQVLPSISDYFHSGANDIFVGILSAVCLSFLVFHGYDWKDFLLGKIAFISCLGIIIFPTNVKHHRSCHNCIHIDRISQVKKEEVAIKAQSDLGILSELSYCPIVERAGELHYGSAIIFFSCLVIFSLVLFPLSYEGVKWVNLTRNRRIRKSIYIFCGLGIFGCMIAIFFISRNCESHEYLSEKNYVFWLETVMLSLFALSWLTKSRMFWKDEEENPPRIPGIIAVD